MSAMSERAAVIDQLITDLPAEDLKALAERMASHVGYVLTAEPAHPDGPAQGPGPGEAVAWRATGPETTLTKSEAELIETLTKAVKSFPSDVEPDDTPTDLSITVKQACELREAIRNLSRERYWRQWERNAAKALAATPTREGGE